MSDGAAQTTVNGGPDGAPPPATTTTEKQGGTDEPVFTGIGKTIKTKEELIEYTKQLETQNVDLRLKMERSSAPHQSMQTNFQQTESTQTKAKEVNPADLLFTDPERAVEMIEQRAEQRVERKFAAKENEKQFWSDFYEENQDLKVADTVVKSVLSQKMVEWKDLPLSDARKNLAEQSRKIVQQVKAQAGTSTEVPSGAAATTGASSGFVPSQGATQTKNVSFIDQVKQFKRRG